MTINPNYLHSDISDLILQAFYTVRNLLSYNLDTAIYKRAINVELELVGLNVETDFDVKVIYKNKTVGSCIIDFVINDAVLIKIINDDMGCKQYVPECKSQLRISGKEVCMILNFSAETIQKHNRVLLTDDFKEEKT